MLKIRLCAAAFGALLLALASAASARTELLRWQHPDPSTVAGFKVYVGDAPGVYQTTLDVGMPTASGGVFSYSLQVPDPNTVYVTVSAYGPTGLEGPRSNNGILLSGAVQRRLRRVSPSQPRRRAAPLNAAAAHERPQRFGRGSGCFIRRLHRRLGWRRDGESWRQRRVDGSQIKLRVGALTARIRRQDG